MTSYNYDNDFFNQINASSWQSAEKIVPYLADILDIDSVIDIGCGQGIWLRHFTAYGTSRAVGVDGEYVDQSKLAYDGDFYPWDLSRPLAHNSKFIEGKFSLVVCLEVAEHLPESRADSLVGDLCRLSDTILFSAAIPGQGGYGHINEQPHKYWLEKFESRGYKSDSIVQETFSGVSGVAFWYRDNTYILRKS